MRGLMIKLGFISAIIAAALPLVAIALSAFKGVDVRYLHQASEVQLNLAQLDYVDGQDPAALYGTPTNTYARVVLYNDERVIVPDENEEVSYYLIKDEAYPVQAQSINAIIKYLVGGLLAGAGGLLLLASFMTTPKS